MTSNSPDARAKGNLKQSMLKTVLNNLKNIQQLFKTFQ